MTSADARQPTPTTTNPAIVVLAWLAVGVPLLWGVFETLKKALALFR
jgi:hypothetical protein